MKKKNFLNEFFLQKNIVKSDLMDNLSENISQMARQLANAQGRDLKITNVIVSCLFLLILQSRL
jgi:hypothetical protein